MEFLISRHAHEEMERRGIDIASVESTLDSPEQIVAGHSGLTVYQQRILVGQRTYLLRVIVDECVEPRKVITVYQTSRVSKYWRAE
jgi:hypothetical protein